MILLLGASGYVGSAFANFFQRNEITFCPVSRSDVNYYDQDSLIRYIRQSNASFLLNAAGFTGKPNVDACEIQKGDCLLANGVLPEIIRNACEFCELPWGHVSSGCIYQGVREDGRGFQESDPPNFCFRTNNCSFYSGCKALGEECLADADNVFLWRMRIPFSHIDSSRNYLSKLIRYERLLDVTNSISHMNDFVRVCWETWNRRVPFGIYNVTNTGSITTRRVTELIKQHLTPDRTFQFFANEEEFMRLAARTPRSSCVLDNSKLRSTGIEIPDVETAIEMALSNWSLGTPVVPSPPVPHSSVHSHQI